MTRSTRMFEIIQILRSADGSVTAQEIADRLEVTKRTIYRDIAALQGMRLPIEGEAGVGYLMRHGFDLPPLMFTADEVEAIFIGLALLGRTGDRGLQRSADRAAAKITQVLPDALSAPPPMHVSDWHQIPTAGIEATDLRRYVRDHRELVIHYSSESGLRTQRTIKPLALLYYTEAIVLAAWCDLRNDFRHFRIDRIEACTTTGHSFRNEAKTLVRQWQQQRRLD